MFFVDPAQRIYVILSPLCGLCGTPGREYFRTINVQWIGQWGAFLAVVAVPRINKLRVINTLNSSTAAASTNISLIINCLQAHFNFVQ
jgi:hypothetical protein